MKSLLLNQRVFGLIFKLTSRRLGIVGLGLLTMLPVACSKLDTHVSNRSASERKAKVDDETPERQPTQVKEGNPSLENSEDQNTTFDGQEAASDGQSASPKFVQQEMEQLTSPFTKKTVLELNAIVARSLAAIERFDEIRRSSNEGSDSAAKLRGYIAASKKASDARLDIEKAGERLRASGEEFSEELFAAMVHFVDDVDVEIRQEIQRLEDEATN